MGGIDGIVATALGADVHLVQGMEEADAGRRGHIHGRHSSRLRARGWRLSADGG